VVDLPKKVTTKHLILKERLFQSARKKGTYRTTTKKKSRGLDDKRVGEKKGTKKRAQNDTGSRKGLIFEHREGDS